MNCRGKTRLANECIILSDGGPTHLEQYTFSNALALSVKLGVWESELEYYIDGIENVTEVKSPSVSLWQLLEECLFRFEFMHLLSL